MVEKELLRREKRRSRFKSCLNLLALLVILLLVGLICFLLQADKTIQVQIDREALLGKLGRFGPILAIPGELLVEPGLLGQGQSRGPGAGGPAGAGPATAIAAPTPVAGVGKAGAVSELPEPGPTLAPGAPRYLSTLPLENCLDFSGYTRPAEAQALGQGWYTMRHYQELLVAAGLLEAGESLVENGQVIAIRKPDGTFFTLQRGLGLQNEQFHWCPKNFDGGRDAAMVTVAGGEDLRVPLDVAPTVGPSVSPLAEPTFPPTWTPTMTASPSATAGPAPVATWTPPPTSTPTATFYPTSRPSPSPPATATPVVASPSPTGQPSPPPTFDPRTPTPFATGCPAVQVRTNGVQIGDTLYSLAEFTKIFNEATGGHYALVSDGEFLTGHRVDRLRAEGDKGPGWVIFTLPEGGIRFLSQNYCLQPTL